MSWVRNWVSQQGLVLSGENDRSSLVSRTGRRSWLVLCKRYQNMENRAGDFGGIVARKTSWRNDISFRRWALGSAWAEWWIGTCMSGISVPTGWDASAPPPLLCWLSGALSLCRSQVGCWITSFSEVTDILPDPIARTRLLARKFKTFWVIGLFLRGSWNS